MEAKYKGLVLFVRDIDISKEFYTNLFQIEIILDFGECIEFDNGLMLWEKEYATNFIYGENRFKNKVNEPNLELYFETPDIESDLEQLESKEIEFVHPIREEPWGQKTARIYDPDKNIIEIGEPMEIVALRLLKSGLSVKDVAEKTQLPEELVNNIHELGDMLYLKWEKDEEKI